MLIISFFKIYFFRYRYFIFNHNINSLYINSLYINYYIFLILFSKNFFKIFFFFYKFKILNKITLNNFFLYIFNNYLKKNIKKFIFLKNNYFFFDYFFKKYFLKKIKKNIIMQINSKIFFFLENNKYYLWIYLFFKKKNILNILNSKLIKLFLQICIIFFYNKDTLILINWLKFIFEKIHYKNHKKILLIFKNIIYFLFKYLRIYFNFDGFIFLLKGKIALGGNSKKKKFLIKYGKCSLTKKNTFISFNKDLLKTLSGVLGYNIYIFY